MTATWNGTVIAQSDDIVTVEGNAYFPAAALDRQYVVDSATRTTCRWKGLASYDTLEVNGPNGAVTLPVVAEFLKTHGIALGSR
jgi:uncharacterized protein (DUF427 family)